MLMVKFTSAPNIIPRGTENIFATTKCSVGYVSDHPNVVLTVVEAASDKNLIIGIRD
jgi:hypothetical protein